ncbi:uncharacterized protein [Solanum tuberosum]|uniref:uncharacterized protein n=1 Tax=Solanum tuberosum TaxID=4113 RepID=UPI00073A2FBF|nr:PREDICTED: uncharacterized protein LOC107059946 [Solanum tuberosum]
MVDPQNIEGVKNLVRPSFVTEVRSFVGLASYDRRFLKNLACIATHLTRLTQNEDKNFIVYASRKLKIHERNYLTRDFELATKGGVLASIEVRPTLIKEIKAKEFENETFNELRKKLVSGKAHDVALYAGGVLSLRRKIFLPRVDDLIQKVLTESHGLW